MSFFQTNRSDKEVEEDQVRDIEKMYETGKIIEYQKPSSSSKNKNNQEILNGLCCITHLNKLSYSLLLI